MSNTQSVDGLTNAIVNAVMGELKGRGGFDHWWDEIDSDIKREIKQALAVVIREKIEA